MATRSRSSVAATPQTARQSMTRPTPQTSQRRVELPEYEAPAHPLNPAGQHKLQALLNNRRIEAFDTRIQAAIDCLSENAMTLNDTVREKDAVVQKDRRRHDRDDGENEEDAARVQKLEEDVGAMRAQVDSMTQRMDTDLRKMIDTREYFASIRPVLQEISNETGGFANSNATPAQPRATQTRSQRRAAVRNAQDDDSDSDEYHDFTPTDPMNAATQSTPLPPAPMTLFRTKLDRRRDRYQNLSHQQRYARDNDYRNFRKLVHDARYGDTDIPLAHESTWFTADGVAALPQPGVTDVGAGQAEEGASDDDLQIAKETISTKCPLTLQEFRHPVTSRKCPHSFEKEAILGMIDNPANTVRLGGSNQRGARDGLRAVQCPVPGCASTLTKDDLHSDPVLLRKIRRIQQANKEAEDDEGDSEEEGGKGRPQEIESGDDDEMDDGLVGGRQAEDDARRVKSERLSGRPR